MILLSLIAINQKKTTTTKDQSTSTANNAITVEDIFDKNKAKKILQNTVTVYNNQTMNDDIQDRRKK